MVIPDGSENREPPENCGADEFRKGAGILPGDVARTIFGSNSEGAESLQAGRPEIAKNQRKMIAAAGLLPPVTCLGNIDAKGTEHAVRFRGVLVEKHQHADGWAPMNWDQRSEMPQPTVKVSFESPTPVDHIYHGRNHPLVEQGSKHLVWAHGRFSSLVEKKRFGVVYPVLPIDVLGSYVLMPVATSS